ITSTVLLSGPPPSFAAATSRSQIASSGAGGAAGGLGGLWWGAAPPQAAGTAPDRPSEQSSRRSPFCGSSSTVSISGSLPPDSARVTTLRQGCCRAAVDVIVPARTCSSTHE